MADEKKLSVSEVRKTVAVSLAAAFGFVIALLWNEVVKAGIMLAGIELVAGEIDLIGWLAYVVTAIVITVVMIILIIVIGRWGNK
jgi:heme/copper-type cytochrome/quinol oxidase subunit 2